MINYLMSQVNILESQASTTHRKTNEVHDRSLDQLTQVKNQQRFSEDQYTHQLNEVNTKLGSLE